MKIQKQTTKPVLETTGIVCNACGKHIVKNEDGYFEDYIAIEKQWGYFSPYDGQKHKLDICHACYQKLLKALTIQPEGLEEDETLLD